MTKDQQNNRIELISLSCGSGIHPACSIPSSCRCKCHETKVITRCCPDCGSTNINHYSWCKIHLTPTTKEKSVVK